MKTGREDRGKFTDHKNFRMNPNASTTNREKRKTKNFMMIRNKVKGKTKRSFQDKQVYTCTFIEIFQTMATKVTFICKSCSSFGTFYN